jgi:phosphotriesterase-related protein
MQAKEEASSHYSESKEVRIMTYNRHDLVDKVMTVSGPVSPAEMGITLTHEHCVIDITSLFQEPEEATAKKLAYDALSFHNVGFIRYHMNDNRDNLFLVDEEQSIKELRPFRLAGGGTIIDATNVDLGRDPLSLRRVSATTGLHIVMGSGYYVKPAQKLAVMGKRSEENIAEEITKDLFHGVVNTDVHSGLIGEIGCSWPLEECEKKVLRAAGLAQKESGAPLMIHPGRSEEAPAEIAGILKEIGTDLSHTVISHIDRTLFEPRNRYALAEAGCYLAYDEWGSEGYYPESFSTTDILNDTQRIAQIKDLFAHGYGSQVLISHDICQKCRYMAYGGHGYNHILYNALPAMRKRGVTEKMINGLLVDNPSRFFAFK